MINKNNCPCRGCEERFPACHDSCYAYQTWQQEKDRIKKDIEGNKDARAYATMNYHRIQKYKREYNITSK